MLPSGTAFSDSHRERVREPLGLFTGTAIGEMLGIPGKAKQLCFRMLHVWEFRDGRMSRESVWLDNAAIVAELTA